ncbi:MAG: fatty acid amide hydrolase 2 [Solirubrobacteraceae bacterium]|jgi:fatty acid amide hydrolase 2|nr:fatty acid amide hydrolase 2 [Solirubrobacteraceae bacterium]
MPGSSLLRRSAVDLAAAIRSGELTSRTVVAAHVEHLRRVNPALRAVVAERYDAALADADAADAQVAAGGELPPLHGVPCTIKESIRMTGMPNSAGTMHRRDFRATDSAPVVDRIRAAGAIPLGVTNTSELTMWIESVNRVYGRTRNVYDPARTAGGSSGGEGAAVGSGGSVFGLGSDIGGSIRLPAFFNGVFGHKPSQGIVPNTGQWPEGDGDSSLMLSMGPLTRRAEDLMPVLRAIAGPDGTDHRARDVVLGDPATVTFDGLDVIVASHASFVPVSRALRDARDRAADALAAAGARVRVEPLRELRRALELYLAVLGSEAGTTVGAMLAPEGAPPATLRSVWRARRSDHTTATILLMLGDAVDRHLPQGPKRKAIAAAATLKREVADLLGDGVLLHPPHPRVAPRHGRTVGRPWVLTPTAAFNLLELPATVIPTGLTAKGLPTGVQAIAGLDRDHVTIAVALELERRLGGRVPPPIGGA